MTNPLIALGQLNRLKTSVLLVNFPQLNVTASYLGEEGINLRMNGPATTRVQAMTGSVPSPEPYVPVTLVIHLVKSQPLSAAYQAQMQDTTLIGDLTVRPDVVKGLGPYLLTNCSIDTVGELTFNGKSIDYGIEIGGNWNVNAALWN